MIITFKNQEDFEDWAGNVILPSKLIAYLEESKEYIFHSNNGGVDTEYQGTIEDLMANTEIPVAKLEEIQLHDLNLNPPAQPSQGDTYSKAEIDAKLEEVESKIGTGGTDTYTKDEIDQKDSDTLTSANGYADEVAGNANNTAMNAEIIANSALSTAESAESRVSNLETQVGEIDTDLQLILGDE